MDEFYYEGITTFLVTGLLEILFPNCQVYLSAYRENCEWQAISNQWVEANLENKIPTLDKDIKSKIFRALAKIASGTEDIHPDRFDWQPLRADSPLFEPLLPFGPPELWLSFPEWVKTEISGLT